MQEVSKAIEAQDTSYSAQLSTLRQVSISEFKKKHYVNVREYYEKDGKLAPGAKGLALDASQWANLAAAFAALRDAAHAG